MFTAIIVDDESKSRLTLATLLEKYCTNINVVAEASNIPAAIEAIQYHKPAIIFLDIQLQDGNGFDLLNQLGKIQSNIIFTTAYDEYAVKAFRFSAIDYLLKPIDPDQLTAAIKKVSHVSSPANAQLKLETFTENFNSTDKKIIIHSHQGLYTIKVADIARCEADSNYTTIFNKNGQRIVTTKSLREYEELLLDYEFFRVHKSHLINLSYIKSCDFTNNTITLDDNSTVEIARRRKESLLQLLKH
jgi:two-component system LytT family response regulator